ncbi:hypothetical protein D3C72_1141760 [compost metagenome]
MILGIDPGANTGVAEFVSGQLTSLDTIEPHELERLLRAKRPGRVVFEDSRLQSHAWNARTKASKGSALATARSLGQVDAWCRLIVAICAELGITAHGISPKKKGKKLDAQQFAKVTGWTAKSNEHCRDAAMVAWPYRGARHE